MPKYDIIIYGATGFTGRLCAEYLAQNAPRAVTWAVAGRSKTKLEAVTDALAGMPSQPDVVVADSNHYQSLLTLARSTAVVLTTVGPYAKYGMGLVKACAETGSDYVDLTGESWFIRESADKFDRQARQSGAAIVHSCGFDSVPSDLGVLYTASLVSDPEDRVTRIDALFRAKGGFSGGTAASGLGLSEQPLSVVLACGRPDFLLPADEQVRPRQPPHHRWAFRAWDGKWAAPFIMASINRQVVLRSASLRRAAGVQDNLSDAGLQYTEHVSMRSWLEASFMSSVLVVLGVMFGVLCRLSPVRWFIGKWLLPAPGTGPSVAVQKAGYFRATFRAITEQGHELMASVSADSDPGYSATAVMICCCALTLAKDRQRTPLGAKGGGVTTPGAALGHPLIDRLNRSGIKFEPNN